MMLLLFLALALPTSQAQLQCADSIANFTLKGSFSVPSPAFLTTGVGHDGANALYISQFFVNPLKPGSVSAVLDIKSGWSDPSAYKAQSLFDFVWPNVVVPIPTSIFQRDKLFTVAGGFLVPGKNTGAVAIFDVSTQPPTLSTISTPLSGHFYHEAVWWDLDGDGLQDLLSARASKPIVGPSTGTLLWFRNPGHIEGPWEQHELLSGPDVFFRIGDLNGDGRVEVVAAEFFSSKLSVYLCQRGAACNISSSWTEIFVDSTIGPPFDVNITDINNDGHVELLVTNHVDNTSLAGVFAYEVPTTLAPGSVWPRHTLAQGFKVLVPGQNQAAPGAARPFEPRTPWLGKPWIIVSGDGAAQAYVLQPLSQRPDDWTYACAVLLSTPNHGTVGGVLVTDVDGDERADIFVTDYDHSTVYAFTFST